jgi:hypothetical protein
MRPFLGGRTDRDDALVNHQADPTKPPGRPVVAHDRTWRKKR